jgi:hypothetical protein
MMAKLPRQATQFVHLPVHLKNFTSVGDKAFCRVLSHPDLYSQKLAFLLNSLAHSILPSPYTSHRLGHLDRSTTAASTSPTMKFIFPVLSLLAVAIADADFGQWEAPRAGDVRSPCPAFNAMSNHKFIPHDGRGLTVPSSYRAWARASTPPLKQ